MGSKWKEGRTKERTDVCKRRANLGLSLIICVLFTSQFNYALTLCSGLKSRAAGVKAKTEPLSYGREREKCVREREREEKDIDIKTGEM